ncbi:peritrophin-48 [Drosophila bipectinata]|uniref:peritrophin-48 n=1 Tax=Drosophila bipectinata TaxID=42026 RepID=UPI001C8AA747|nr:peritrophin-48 [Drosophila bipectinata]
MNTMKRASGILSLLFVASALGSVIEDFEYLEVSDMCGLLPLGTNFLRPNTCDNWVSCAGNFSVFEQGTCASGLYYNKTTGRCANAASVSCPYKNVATEPANVCANETDGSFVMDPTSRTCRGYILCKNRKQIKANCPNELIFHPISRSCVYQNQYTCPETQTKTASPTCRALTNGTRLAHPKQCVQYYECDDDILHERSCPAQMAYDSARGRCVDMDAAECFEGAVLPEPENTFCLDEATGSARVGYFADEESCSNYYICGEPVADKHDTEPKHMSCPLGQYFDSEKLSCRDRMNVRCRLDRCIGTNMSYVNVDGNCQAYGRCSNGLTVSMGHCPSGYYFDERSQGCSLTNFNYIACSAQVSDTTEA